MVTSPVVTFDLVIDTVVVHGSWFMFRDHHVTVSFKKVRSEMEGGLWLGWGTFQTSQWIPLWIRERRGLTVNQP